MHEKANRSFILYIVSTRPSASLLAIVSARSITCPASRLYAYVAASCRAFRARVRQKTPHRVGGNFLQGHMVQGEG